MAMPVVYANEQWESYSGSIGPGDDVDAFPLPDGVQPGDLLIFIIHDHGGDAQNWVSSYERFFIDNSGEHQTEFYWRWADGTSDDQINGLYSTYGSSGRVLGTVLRVVGATAPPSASSSSGIFASGFTNTVVGGVDNPSVGSVASPGSTDIDDVLVFVVNVSDNIDWGDGIRTDDAPWPPFSGVNFSNLDEEMWALCSALEMPEPDIIPGFNGPVHRPQYTGQEFFFFGVTGYEDEDPGEGDDVQVGLSAVYEEGLTVQASISSGVAVVEEVSEALPLSASINFAVAVVEEVSEALSVAAAIAYGITAADAIEEGISITATGAGEVQTADVVESGESVVPSFTVGVGVADVIEAGDGLGVSMTVAVSTAEIFEEGSAVAPSFRVDVTPAYVYEDGLPVSTGDMVLVTPADAVEEAIPLPIGVAVTVAEEVVEALSVASGQAIALLVAESYEEGIEVGVSKHLTVTLAPAELIEEGVPIVGHNVTTVIVVAEEVDEALQVEASVPEPPPTPSGRYMQIGRKAARKQLELLGGVLASYRPPEGDSIENIIVLIDIRTEVWPRRAYLSGGDDPEMVVRPPTVSMLREQIGRPVRGAVVYIYSTGKSYELTQEIDDDEFVLTYMIREND